MQPIRRTADPSVALKALSQAYAATAHEETRFCAGGAGAAIGCPVCGPARMRLKRGVKDTMTGQRLLISLSGETVRLKPRLVFFCCLGTLCLVGCGDRPNEPGDLSSFFAPPTAAEIAAVQSDWDARDLQSTGWEVLGDGDIGGLRVEVVSHAVEGDTRYGLVRYPQRYNPSQCYPVLVFNHGEQDGVSTNALTESRFSNGCLRDFFIVVPSFRGEELGTGELGLSNLISEGEPSELDGDVDDTIALLNTVLETMPGANASRIAVFGRGYGGGVSHLVAARDSRITLGVVFSGPTDHITHPDLQERVEAAINGDSPPAPPVQTMMDAAVTPFLAGEITLCGAEPLGLPLC